MNEENPALGLPDDDRPAQQDNVTKLPQRAPLAATGGRPLAIIPRTFDEAYRIGKAAVVGKWAPYGWKDEQATLAILHGAEVGLPPMMSLQKICVINGRPSIWGDAVPAIALATGQLEDWSEGIRGDGEDMVAFCIVKRRGIKSPMEVTFSVADARRAGLWDERPTVGRMVWDKKKGQKVWKEDAENDSPWYRYPKIMMQMRARRAFRNAFADAFSGLYISEELQEDEMRDVTPAAQPIIHNPLQDDADLAERPARDIRDDLRAPAGTVVLEGEDAARALTEPEPDDGAVVHADGSVTRPTGKEEPDVDPETGETFDAKVDSERRNADGAPGTVDNMAGVTGTPSTGLAHPVEPQKPASGRRQRPRPVRGGYQPEDGERPSPPTTGSGVQPRQAATEPAGEPKAEAAPKQPAPEKTSPGANGALGVAFAQPWIRRKAADYEAYLVEWTAAWIAFGQDPNGLRDRYGAERTIRSGLGEPADQDTLTRWKGIATEAFKKLGGVLQ
jgi:hypothetical protein